MSLYNRFSYFSNHNLQRKSTSIRRNRHAVSDRK
nr:MAG TPA: hypothetical protein [Caudoviricetes sp.]